MIINNTHGSLTTCYDKVPREDRDRLFKKLSNLFYEKKYKEVLEVTDVCSKQDYQAFTITAMASSMVADKDFKEYVENNLEVKFFQCNFVTVEVKLLHKEYEYTNSYHYQQIHSTVSPSGFKDYPKYTYSDTFFFHITDDFIHVRDSDKKKLTLAYRNNMVALEVFRDISKSKDNTYSFNGEVHENVSCGMFYIEDKGINVLVPMVLDTTTATEKFKKKFTKEFVIKNIELEITRHEERRLRIKREGITYAR